MLARIHVYLERHRLLRMFVAGGANTAFGFCVFSLSHLVGLPTWAALLAGLIAGTVFNFVTTGHYVFRQLSVDRYPRFVACYLLLYLLNLGLIKPLFYLTQNDVVSQAILALPLALTSYFLLGRVVFNKNDQS